MTSGPEHLAGWAAVHGGYDPSSSRLLAGWLRAVRVCAQPLAALRMPPNVITSAGVALAGGAVAVAGPRPTAGRLALVAALVMASGLADALDGAVAVLTHRTTTFGFVLDSMADRFSDLLFALVLWRLGAPAWLCISAGALTFMHEYLRARATVAGMAGIGALTVAERPTRLGLAVLAPAAATAVGHPQFLAGAAGWVWVTLGVLGLLQLLASVRSHVS